MKDRVFVLFLLFLHSIIPKLSNAQEWEFIYPNNLGESGDLVKGIIPPNSNKVYLLGNDILRFDNSGNFLNNVGAQLPFQENAVRDNFDIQFVSESKAYMALRNSIFSSNDTGQTWTENLVLSPVNSEIESSSYFNALHFPSQNTGYAVGSFEKIFKTEDGGTSWQEISSNPSTAPYIWYRDVFFFDELNGYISGFEVVDILQNFGFQSFVLRTDDGGESWQRFNIPAQNDYRRSTIDYKNGNTGFIFFSQTQQTEKIFVTNDSSQTWTDITPDNVGAIHSVKWLDSNSGFLFGEINNALVLLKTVDQGQSWYEVSLPLFNNLSENTINDMVFLNENIGYALGIGGSILFSEDAGETWEVLSEATIRIFEADYITNDNAFATTGSELYQSSNGGQTWSYIEAPTLALSNFVLRAAFTNSTEGVVLGFGNQYVKTEDGFMSFELGTLPENFFFFNKYISTNQNRFYIAGTTSGSFTNKLLTSDDGGDIWTVEDIGVDGNFVNNLQVLDDGTLIVQTDFSIVSSTDDGINWDTLYHSTAAIQNCVFVNNEIGYAYTAADLAQGQVRRIVNNETPTSELITIIPNSNLDFEFLGGILPIDEYILYAFGFKRNGFKQFATIWKSEDAGESWQEEILPNEIAGNIKTMILQDEFIIAISSQGQIIRYSFDILSLAERDATSQEIIVFPNPSKGEVSISASGVIKNILVYSTNGQVLRAIKSNEKTLSLDLSSLSAGLYILRITTSNGILTKMIIRK